MISKNTGLLECSVFHTCPYLEPMHPFGPEKFHEIASKYGFTVNEDSMDVTYRFYNNGDAAAIVPACPAQSSNNSTSGHCPMR